MNIFEKLFKRVNFEEPKIRGRLPFVHLFGHEKTYGAPQPQDYNRMVDAYRSWAYACAWKNGTSVAKVNLKLHNKIVKADGKTDLEEITEHPFIEVLQKVNPFSNRFELLTITQIFLELTGNAYWWMPKDVFGVPYMIWNIPANWVKIIPSKEKFIDGYVVSVPGSGKGIIFDETEVVHFKFPSPFDMFYGTGPLFAGAYGIDLNAQMKTWAINFFTNNAQPSGVLMSEDGMSEMEYQRLRDEWNRMHKGAKNAAKMAILEGGLKYQQIGSSLKDFNLTEVSKEPRNEILSMFGVPASKLGLVEDVNRANADANDYTYQKETILPRLLLMEEKINEKIIPVYDNTIIAKFEDNVPEDSEFKLRQAQINVQTGITTIDEERIALGLEPFNLPETSVPLIPFSLTPAGQPKPSMDFGGGGNDDEDDKEDEEKKSMTKIDMDAFKTKKWEMYIMAIAPQDKLLTESMARYFELQHSEVMRRLNLYRTVSKDIYENIIFNEKDAVTNLKGRTKKNVRIAYVTGLEIGIKETGHAIDFTLFEPNITKAVEQRLSFFATSVNKTTARLLENAINDGLEIGESINDISKRVDGIFAFSRDFRSKRIAQTEVIGASNMGQLKAYDEAGVEVKEWVTARDEKVRDSHQIDGQQKGMTDTFVTRAGIHLLAPGDRTTGAPAGEVINCRCTVLPIIKLT